MSHPLGPVLNRPAASEHMTAAEWARLHRDYKDISVRDGYRVRTALVYPCQLVEVYLTDKPTKEVEA